MNMQFDFVAFIRALMLIIGIFGTAFAFAAALVTKNTSLLWWCAATLVLLAVAMAVD